LLHVDKFPGRFLWATGKKPPRAAQHDERMTVTELATVDLLRELEPVASAQLDRHLALAQEWMPHDFVPWDRGRDFTAEPWVPADSTLSRTARIALEVNLLTEDNLPSYHREIAAAFGRDSAWGTWVHRWTAEESRHSLVIRDYLMVTRSVDPDALERARIRQLERGFDGAGRSALQVLAYVAFQELATRISHRNTANALDDPAGQRVLARVAADENLHMVFYRDLVGAALELAPGPTMRAIADEVVGFQMPGAGIEDFGRKAALIARAGIYDLRIHHDQVLLPHLRTWRFFEREASDPTAEQAQTEVRAFLDGLDATARAQEARAARAG
jgi:acyl-[acyl-carrier-protein] desaturase